MNSQLSALRMARGEGGEGEGGLYRAKWVVVTVNTVERERREGGIIS
jgi:hypothetical protein